MVGARYSRSGMQRIQSSSVISAALCMAGDMFGVDLADVLARHGVVRGELADGDRRVPSQLEMDLFDELAARTGEPAFGIKHASLPAPPMFELADYLARASATLGDAYHNVLRFQSLLHDGVGCDLRLDGAVARFRHHLTPGIRISRHAVELALATVVMRGRSLTGKDWAPRAVSLRTPEPIDPRPYRALFRCDISFEQATSEVAFDRALLDEPLLAADPGLYKILEQTAEARLAARSSEHSFLDEVKREVCRQLRGDLPKVDKVARRLSMSARTLHHRLRTEGRTWQEVVDDVRLEMATTYLGDPGIKGIEVGFLLGFSDASAFYRAFRRWTGLTPIEFRERLPARGQS